MKIDNPRIDKDSLAQRVQNEFGINLRAFTFFPVGEDSYGYVNVSETSTKYFIKVYDKMRRPNLEE